MSDLLTLLVDYVLSVVIVLAVVLLPSFILLWLFDSEFRKNIKSDANEQKVKKP